MGAQTNTHTYTHTNVLENCGREQGVNRGIRREVMRILKEDGGGEGCIREWKGVRGGGRTKCHDERAPERAWMNDAHTHTGAC